MTLTCISAYSILDVEQLSWSVRRYRVRSLDGRSLSQEDRSRLKSFMWDLKREHRAECRGYGYVIDTGTDTVVVPSEWRIPAGIQRDGLALVSVEELTASAASPQYDAIVSGIVREALKLHIKNLGEPHGPFWQDFGRFCQFPEWRTNDRVSHCRGFEVRAKRGARDRWLASIDVRTTSVDARSIAEYFKRAQADELASLIEIKRQSHTSRDGKPGTIRAFCHGDGMPEGHIVELEEPEVLMAYASLSPSDQRALAGTSIRCRAAFRQPELIPPGALHLLLDSQQTEDLHEETILEPAERFAIMGQIRDLLDGAELHGPRLRLDEAPVDCSRDMLLIGPPDVVTKSARGIEVLKCRQPVNADAIQQRSRERRDRVVQHGFLVSRPMRALLAVPEKFATARAQRLLDDCNELLREHGVTNVEFAKRTYRDSSTIRKVARDGGFDSVLAVLPESHKEADETYERIKRTLEIPSQCMKARSVIPANWAERSPHEFARKEPRLARKLSNQLDLTLINLLVKHNWIPYAPATPYHFNVQIGIDVGGLHNTVAAACIGYGFSAPSDDIIFRMDEIAVPGAKKEPIRSSALREGLLQMLEQIAEGVNDAGQQFNATRLIVYRDGPLLGQGEAWNEIDAFSQLLDDARSRGWILGEPQWAALELAKGAEGMRVFDCAPHPKNPLVGRCVFPFSDPNTALVCSTGHPYLTQGTAAPLKAHLVELAGSTKVEDALRDLVWQCDLGFTKPDMGFSLPWVLRVADAGALQRSRSYKISGIAA